MNLRVLPGPLRCAAAAAALLLALPMDAPSAAEPDLEQQKAEFALNFAKFTYWPPDRFPAVGGKFTLCQFRGTARLTRALAALQGRSVQGHPIEFRRIDNLAQAPACMLLFSAGRAPELLASDAVLTVGDGVRFAQQGGMIGFVQNGSRLGFEVNLAAMQRSGFAMSSQALSLASRVIEPAEHASAALQQQPRFVPAASDAMTASPGPAPIEPADQPPGRGR